MGFFSKLFSNPNDVRKFCDQRVIDYYFYKENGVWYSRRPLCFRPYFTVDENNNLVEVAFKNDNSQSVPLYFGIFSNIRTQYSKTNEKEILLRNPKSDIFEYHIQRGHEEPFVVTRESLLNRLSDCIPYHIFVDHHDKTKVLRQVRLKCKKDDDDNLRFFTDNWDEEILELCEYSPEKISWHKKSPISFPRVNGSQLRHKHSSLYSSLLDSDGKPLKRCLWVFDFETTGLRHDIDEIVEIGLCIYEILPLSFGEVKKEYSCLRKVKVPDEVAKLTCISQEMIDKDGLDDKQILNDLSALYEKYGENAIFASYNLYFDASFFMNYLRRNEVKMPFDWLDILTIARDRFDYPHKLGEIIQRIIDDPNSRANCLESDLNLLKKSVNSHRAIDDAKAACNLLLVMMHSFDDIAKYIGVIGHPLKHPFMDNHGIGPYLANPNKGRERFKILSRVQYYKREYPIYFSEKRDNDLYLNQHEENWCEISDCFIDIDYKLVFEN